jgi:hypothetical protein
LYRPDSKCFSLMLLNYNIPSSFHQIPPAPFFEIETVPQNGPLARQRPKKKSSFYHYNPVYLS